METPEENEFLKSLLQDWGYTTDFWIGLSDIKKEGTNVWEETGAYPTYDDYWPQNVEDDSHDCKSMFYDLADDHYQYGWRNRECSKTSFFICEYPVAGSTP